MVALFRAVWIEVANRTGFDHAGGRILVAVSVPVAVSNTLITARRLTIRAPKVRLASDTHSRHTIATRTSWEQTLDVT